MKKLMEIVKMNKKILVLVLLIFLIIFINISFFIIFTSLTGKVVLENQESDTIIFTTNKNNETSNGILDYIIETFSSGKSSGGSSGSSDKSSEGSSSSGGGSSDVVNNNLIYLNFSEEEIKINQEFNLSIKIKSDAKIYGVQLDLIFNSEIASAISVVEGNFLKENSSIYSIISINNSDGKINLASTRYSTQNGVDGEGEIYFIQFIAKNSGNATFEIENVKVSDINMQSVNFEGIVKNVIISESQ